MTRLERRLLALIAKSARPEDTGWFKALLAAARRGSIVEDKSPWQYVTCACPASVATSRFVGRRRKKVMFGGEVAEPIVHGDLSYHALLVFQWPGLTPDSAYPSKNFAPGWVIYHKRESWGRRGDHIEAVPVSFCPHCGRKLPAPRQSPRQSPQQSKKRKKG